MTIIAALHHPLTAGGPAGDDPDMMRPHHDRADGGAACARSDMRPIARKPEVAIVEPELIAEPPAAPCGGTSAATGNVPAATRTVVRKTPMTTQRHPSV